VLEQVTRHPGIAAGSEDKDPRARRRGIVILAACLCFGVSLWAICAGAISISFQDVIAVILEKAGETDQTGTNAIVIWHLRIPRVLLGLLVGGTLSVSGVLLQGLFRNPLADPGLIGVSAGAAFGAVCVLIFAGIFFPAAEWMQDIRFLPLAAFAGALGTAVIIYRIGTSSGATSVASLLLAGIAVNALVSSLIGLATFLATDIQLRTLSFWTLGSLGGAAWKQLAIASPLCGVVLVLAPRFGQALNAAALGEREAAHLGFDMQRVKWGVIILTTLGVGTCVAFSGMIGFVALIVPHLCRFLVGADHRWLIPCSAFAGASMLVLSDVLARTCAAPAELPIGILTSAAGGPFFLWLLVNANRRARVP
jgi:iron complex transport system permease protein